MWLATTYGWFSLVSGRQGDGAHGQPLDPERMMLRARSEDHLRRLRQRFPDLIGGCAVVRSVHADYPVRLLLPRTTAITLVGELVADIATDNFKRAAGELHGHGSQYLHCLHDTWSVMRRLDDRRPAGDSSGSRSDQRG